MKLADLLEEFNVVIDTAEGLTELRSLILGLAVRGKLVPQDPNDEPASELLKMIEAEKERLYEEGEFPKPKKLKEIKDDEFPFDIPDNWKWVKFGRIMDFQGGSQPPKSKFIDSPKEGYVQLIQIRDLGDKPQPVYVPKDSVTKLCTSDDIMIGRYGASVGKVFWGKDGAYNVALIKILFGKQNLNSGYLYQFFNSDLFQNALAGISRSAQAGFNKGNVLPQPFPLPPLAEQHRIVKKIESLFAEVDELEEKLNRQAKLDEKLQMAVDADVQQAPDADASKSAWSFITSNFDTLYHTPEAIDNLKKNILNEAVRGRLVPQNPNDEPASELLKKIEAEKQRLYEEGEIRKPKDLPPVKEDEVPFEIPESWEWVRLSTVSNVEMGQSPPGNTYNKVGDGIPLINGPVEFGKGPLAKTKVVQYSTKPKKLCKEGDLLLCVRGSTLGRTNIAGFDACIGRGVAAIQPYFEGIYLHYYIVSERQNIYDFGTGSTFPSINKGNIENYIFPLPPLEEQHRIVRRIEELFAISDRFKAQLEQREKVNERLVKGLVGEVLEKAGSLDRESIQEKEISIAAESKSDYQIPKKPTSVDYYRRTVLAAEIVWQLHHQPTLGHVKLQKIIYLAQQTSKMMLPTNFVKQAAGPYDPQMARSLDKQLKKNKWFKFQKDEFLKYKPLEKAGEHNSDFDKYFHEEKENIQFLIDTFKKAKTEQVEIVATLFACWEELIEDGKTVTDDLLIKQFYNWSEEKTKFKQNRLVKAINWMRDEGVFPVS